MSEPLPMLPPRAPDSHKGTFGTALLIGGSRDIPGAIALAGMAALRSGAGLVRLAVPRAIHPVVAGFEPCYTTAALECDEEGRIAAPAAARLAEMLAKATAVAIGPGLGRSAGLDGLVRQLYQLAPLPMVVDADGLNALTGQDGALRAAAGPRILTPHPGEFSRLTGLKTAEIQARREETAAQFSARCGAIVVLKGHRTVIADAKRVAINSTGNPGMATGGTGDVLTGIITALLAQGMSPFDAARLGAHVHGLAGDLAAKDKGQIGLIARDVIEYLPGAFRSL